MKHSIFILTLLVLNLQAFAQENTTQEIRVPLSKPNETGILEASLISGSITVIGSNTKEIVIKASLGKSDTKPRGKEEAGGLKWIANNSLGITVEEQNNMVEVSSEAMNRIVNLEIQVPQNFSLKLGTVNHGNLVVRNVNGNFELDNVNGSITLENVSGNAVANTTNGPVKANFLRWDNKSPMAFSTLNGDVDITLPANSKFSAKLNSDMGEIYTDFELAQDTRKAQAKAEGRSDGGVYRVSTADFITGKVNGGGAEIMVKNMHGNIYLRKAKK
ncbi:DUF4097 family beta strand repeat-containing protein [Pontibacter roseus]|uniref:DUF4097 family beta strand repeat-containing protein n=1 Tax=Pontibacter roseus TaxID=336989 RepID=UPI000371636F|nr:DUF4097 family beta strand repeat-containing protein [Pontibacter roseus]